MSDFNKMFQKITKNQPYPWQTRLYRSFIQGNFPNILDIPTGLGKTSVMTIWMLALITNTDRSIHIPTRLVYIVDRRVIVDQASTEAHSLQSEINNGQRLNVSSLRGGGGCADSREWIMEPHIPAIIVGTIDMIGSRLLFSGYGIGRNTRPLYAGMLGQDSLIILDETHLSPAMEDVLKDVPHIAKSSKCPLLPPKVMLMSATQRSEEPTAKFSLNSEDMCHPEIKKRYESKKFLRVIETSDVLQRVTTEALNMNGRVLVYLQKPKDVQKISSELRKLKERVVTLTGTMRGFERDQLVKNKDYVKFTHQEFSGRRCFLVSTSAGEVGVDLDADNMVCDITTLDSMIQRLGRVNRSGGRQSQIVMVYSKDQMGRGIMKERYEKTLNILQEFANNKVPNVNPAALERIDYNTKMSAFSPTPETQPLTQDVLDMWSMTSLYKRYASRPSVHYWLRGKPEARFPETHVVWRDDIPMLARLDGGKILEILDEYRILPHEMARGKSVDVHRMLQTMGNIDVVIYTGSTCITKKASEISRSDIEYVIVLLPCTAGGLDDGMLGGTKRTVNDIADEAKYSIRPQQDVNCKVASDIKEQHSQRQRTRIVANPGDDGQYYVTKIIKDGRFQDTDITLDDWLNEHPQMRLVCSAELDASHNKDETSEEIRYYVKVREKQGSTATGKQSLDKHHAEVENKARQIVDSLGVLNQDIADAIVMAASIHDNGKKSDYWQQCMHVPEKDRPLAKTGRRVRPLPLGGFRHEFASVVNSFNEVEKHPERDLIQHLVAAHHGWARPCFKHDALIEGDHVDKLHLTMLRYSHLQGRFGPWGLAWLEGLLRGADWASSAALDSRKMQ